MNKGFKGFRLINNLKSQKTNHHEEAILEEGAGDRDHDSHGHRNDTGHGIVHAITMNQALELARFACKEP